MLIEFVNKCKSRYECEQGTTDMEEILKIMKNRMYNSRSINLRIKMVWQDLGNLNYK